jgi:hypothetical protein
MAATVSFQPFGTTNAAGTFSVTEAGLVQGTALDSPNARYNLAGGIVDLAAPGPLWGGMGISEAIPLSTGGITTPSQNFGGYIDQATNVTANTALSLTGFTVFDQAYNGIMTPANSVPLYYPGQTCNLYRLGSGARLVVKCAPSLVNLDGGIITQRVSWDFTTQQLVPYNAAYPANAITAATWANTAGGQATFTTTTAHGVAVGEYFTITGVTPTAYNGEYLAIAGTTGSTLVGALPLASTPGAGTAFGTLVAGGGALPCSILRVEIGNCFEVDYNPVTSTAVWNNNGNCAVILI